MMSLEQAIKHCEEVAEENEKECKLWEGGVTEAFKQKEERLRECANEHRQLAEWLKELEQLRKIYMNGYEEGYKDAKELYS